MKIHDISLTLSESIPTWSGDLSAKFERILEIEKGGVANVTAINMSAHAGTHVDAPIHFLKEGYGVEKLSLNVLIGECRVIEVNAETVIRRADLEGVDLGSAERLLIKTKNSKQWEQGATEFIEDFVGLDDSAAKYLVETGVKLVGIDYLSIAPLNDIVPTHQTLLKAEVIILEGINLTDIQPGGYTLYCLPLKIAGSDGAPARAILMESS